MSSFARWGNGYCHQHDRLLIKEMAFRQDCHDYATQKMGRKRAESSMRKQFSGNDFKHQGVFLSMGLYLGTRQREIWKTVTGNNTINEPLNHSPIGSINRTWLEEHTPDSEVVEGRFLSIEVFTQWNLNKVKCWAFSCRIKPNQKPEIWMYFAFFSRTSPGFLARHLRHDSKLRKPALPHGLFIQT